MQLIRSRYLLAFCGAVLIGMASAALAERTGTEVMIRNFLFEPTTITVKAGDAVTWQNADIAPHTATAEDGSWDTGELAQGDSAALSFERPGHYGYICAYHPSMTGMVVVE